MRPDAAERLASFLVAGIAGKRSVQVVCPVETLWQRNQDILDGDHDEQQQQEHHPNAVNESFLLGGHGLATQGLKQDEKDPSAVKRGASPKYISIACAVQQGFRCIYGEIEV